MAKKKTNEQFVEELKLKNPKVIPLESYINAISPILLKCNLCGYKWSGIPNNILRGEGCPACAKNQRLSAESFEKRMITINPNITILGEYKNNKTPIKYLCRVCGSENEASPSSLLQGHGCNNCAIKIRSAKRTKSDETFREELVFINPTVEILSIYEKRDFPIKCRCTVCGYIFISTPSALLSGRKCYQCKTGKSPLQKQNSTFLAEIENKNPTIEPLENYKGATTKISFLCKECGYVWPSRPQQLLRGQGCPKCQRRWQTSFPEQAIFFYIKKIYPDALNSYKSGFGQSELDVFIPSLKIGIEYDGRNWHKGNGKKEEEKYVICKENKIFLIRVVEQKGQLPLEQICDYYIDSAYGDTKNKYLDLDSCIRTLFTYLHIDCDINTERDQYSIKNQYYARRKSESLESRFPEIAKEWYQPYNGLIKPYMVSPTVSDSYYWKCQKCGKIYASLVSNRVKGHGCSRCANVERKTSEQFIEELKKINPQVQILDSYTNSTTPIKYICHKCGAIGTAWPRVLLKGNGCTNCHKKEAASKKALSHSEFMARAKKNYPNVEFKGNYDNSNTVIECRCMKCGNIWSARANSILSKNTGCASCAGIKKKKVICVETNIVYESIHQAEMLTKISHASISNCCNEKALTAGGYHWRFVEK